MTQRRIPSHGWAANRSTTCSCPRPSPCSKKPTACPRRKRASIRESATPPAKESPASEHTEVSSMKFKFAMYPVLVASFLALSVSLFAHHGTGVAYETEKLVTVKGTVTD